MTSHFLETLVCNELCQDNVLPTCNVKPLNLVLGNDLSVFVTYAESLTSSTHQALEVIVSIDCESTASCTERITFNFNKTNFDCLYRLLASLSWVI